MTERDEAREARIRLDAARRHITQAMEAISGARARLASLRGARGHGVRRHARDPEEGGWHR